MSLPVFKAFQRLFIKIIESTRPSTKKHAVLEKL